MYIEHLLFFRIYREQLILLIKKNENCIIIIVTPKNGFDVQVSCYSCIILAELCSVLISIWTVNGKVKYHKNTIKVR